jgi:hypothetical protein
VVGESMGLHRAIATSSSSHAGRGSDHR